MPLLDESLNLMTTNSDSKVALLGCGMWGRNIARNLASLSALTAVYDTHPDRAASFAKEFDASALSLDAILKDDTICAVAIAASATTHKDLALAALDAGKHVYIEKPMALTLKDAKAIQDKAQEIRRGVMVGHLIRYHSAFVTLQACVADHMIGKIKHIQANRLAMGRIRTTESVLFDLCPHDLSLVLALAGEMPNHITCHGASHITENVVDILTTGLGFANGISATLHTSWLNPFKEHKLTVIGETGSLVFDDTKDWAEKVTYYKDTITPDGHYFQIDRENPVHVDVPPSEPLKDEMRAFLTLCADGTLPPSHGGEAVMVQEVLEIMQAKLQDVTQK